MKFAILISIILALVVTSNKSASRDDFNGQDKPTTETTEITATTTTTETTTAAAAATPTSAGGQCPHKFIPGLDRMSNGVDITQLDLFPADIHGEDGFKRRLFSFTCGKYPPWTPTEDGTSIYSRPDQVDSLYEVPASSIEIKLNFQSTQKSLKMSMKASVDVDLSALKGAFSASASYIEAKSLILEKQRSTHTSSDKTTGYRVGFISPSELPLNPEFVKLIHSLPLSYETDPQQYDDLLKEFGTHFFGDALFGGCLRFKTDILNSYMYATSDRSLRANLSGKYVFLSGKMLGEFNATATTGEIGEEINVSFKVFGGNYVEGKKNDSSYRAEWEKTVLKRPWLVHGKLRPIDELIKNPAIQKGVKKAVLIRHTRAFLKDFVETQKSTGFNLTSKQEKVLDTIKEYLSNPKMGEERLREIGIQLTELFEYLQEILDRGLLEELAGKLRELLLEHFFEAKRYFMQRDCPNKYDEQTIKVQFKLFWTLTTKLHRLNSTSPLNTDQIQRTAKKVYPYFQRHVQVDGFCDGGDECKKCAIEKLTYGEERWSIYPQFYRNKLILFKENGLNCKVKLAKHCGVKGDFLVQSEELETLDATLKSMTDNQNDPMQSKSRIVELVTQAYRFLDKLEKAPIDGCPPQSPCLECLHYNMDCWNSNPAYLSYPCRKESEWNFMKYKPKKIEPDCKSRYLQIS